MSKRTEDKEGAGNLQRQQNRPARCSCSGELRRDQIRAKQAWEDKIFPKIGREEDGENLQSGFRGLEAKTWPNRQGFGSGTEDLSCACGSPSRGSRRCLGPARQRHQEEKGKTNKKHKNKRKDCGWVEACRNGSPACQRLLLSARGGAKEVGPHSARFLFFF